jgi:hypothetical protein
MRNFWAFVFFACFNLCTSLYVEHPWALVDTNIFMAGFFSSLAVVAFRDRRSRVIRAKMTEDDFYNLRSKLEEDKNG